MLFRLRTLLSILTLASLVGFAMSASAQVLLRDDFDDTSGPVGAQGDGIVDVTTYRTPFGDGAFLGRTQLRFDLPGEGLPTTDPTSTDGKVAVIELDTFNPLDPGAAFFGTDLITKSNFARGNGLRWEGRMRLRDNTPAGLVGAGFLYDVTRSVETTPGNFELVRDEIDHELLSNASQGATPHNTFTNIWDDGAFVGPGAGGTGATINTAPVSPTFSHHEFANYRIDWLPNRVEYYINDTLVRTESGVVPDDPMSSHFNLWAPDNTFTSAFDPSLQPTSDMGMNQTYALEVDYVEITRLDTAGTELLADGGFENLFFLESVSDPFNPPPFNADTETGEWVTFNSASLATNSTRPTSEGSNSVAMFGPFRDQFDASGMWQNAPASAGQEFRASIKTLTESTDSIFRDPDTGEYDGDTKVRFLELSLQFRDAAGNVIQEIPSNPDSVPANDQVIRMLDSSDPLQQNLEDEWIEYSIDAIAPEGTALVRYQVNFVQDGNLGTGSALFDEASLQLLEAILSGVTGDYNNDGVVDAADYTVWRDAEGTTSVLPNDPIGGSVGANQYALWSANFGSDTPASSAAVPEPTALLLGALGVAALGARRRS